MTCWLIGDRNGTMHQALVMQGIVICGVSDALRLASLKHVATMLTGLDMTKPDLLFIRLPRCATITANFQINNL